MSGNRKNGKGKGREKDQGDTSAFQVDLSREKGKTIYIPGSFWGLKDADAEKLWECSVFQYDEHALGTRPGCERGDVRFKRKLHPGLP